MSFESINNPCPCESGLEYPYCCGASDRNELNILGEILADGQIEGNLPAGLRQSIESINSLPDLYPARLDLLENTVHFVKMSPYWYSESVFLDSGRILGTCGIRSSAQWLLENTCEIESGSSPIIFHTAFCGSTLMSKALDVIYTCLPVREPEALNNLLVYLYSQASDSQKQEWFQRILSLLGRRYEENQPVVIKTSDYSNGLLKTVVLNRPDVPVLFMYTSLAEFFSSCIKADSRQTWVHDRYLAIADRVSDLIPEFQRDEIDVTSVGQLSAVYWSYNISLYYDALQSASLSIESVKLRCLNFSEMLDAPMDTVHACAKWFGLEPQEGVDDMDEMRWLFGVYSKDIEHEYSPKKRSEDIIGILKENVSELVVAELMAKKLLADKYPEHGLPGSLLAN